MATGVQVWSQSPASNATSDSNINWAEGQAPSSVNDSARAMMASVAKWNNDNNGTLVTSGSSTALTLVTNQVEASLVSGYTVRFQFGTAAGAAATLAVDGLAAKPLQAYNGIALIGGEWLAGDYSCFTYTTTGTGQWIWGDSTPANTSGFQAVTQGTFNVPAGTASGTGVMMGLGATPGFFITPVRGSRVLVVINGYATNTVGLAQIQIQLGYGTGTAPVNGAALTGTAISNPVLVQASQATALGAFSVAGVMTGLTPGTAAWIDLRVAALGGGTASVASLSVTAVEL